MALTARAQLGLLPPEFPPAVAVKSERSKGQPPEELFASQCRIYRLPRFEEQMRFARAIGRQWRFDFAFPEFMVAVEIEGIVPRQYWEAELDGRLPVMTADESRVFNVVKVTRAMAVFGRHASVAGIIEDMEKYNAAAMLGWSVLRFPPKHIKPKHAIETTMRVLAARGWKP